MHSIRENEGAVSLATNLSNDSRSKKLGRLLKNLISKCLAELKEGQIFMTEF